jgi:DNA-binding SARP family transcriptional activator
MVDGNGLRIDLLGELRLSMRGRPVALPPSKKTRALLAYLVATGGPHPRERLCDLLWDGPDDPRAALRWSLTKLRPLLDADDTLRLLTDRERVAFVPNGADIDLQRLPVPRVNDIVSTTTDKLEAAAACFSGEFLEGLDLPSCFRFHEWCAAEREKWSSLRVAILTALVDRWSETPEIALGHARSWVNIDPLDERAHATVIRLLATLGRPREATRQYEYCRQVLETELGTKPGVELARAFALLKTSNHRRVHKERPERRLSISVSEAALVGRERECTALDAIAMDAAGANAGMDFVLLSGDPGIGKTRLLRYFAQAIAGLGGLALEGRAFEAEIRRPYGIWVDMLARVPEHTIPLTLREELRPLIFGADGSPTAKEGDRVRLYSAVVALLRALSAQAPIAILTDDLQWIDEASVSLLHYALRAFDMPGSVVIAATARSGEISDNDPAWHLVRGMAREGRLTEIPLGPLDTLACTALARAMAPGRDVTPVVAVSEGNPLFTLELSRALASGSNALPGTMKALLMEHLSRPEGAARALLPWAAALGRAFDVDLLARCVRLSPSEWDDALEELERRGIIRGIGENRYDFSHDLLRSLAYGLVSQPRRRLIHGQIARSIAAALEAHEGGAEFASELVRHAALGGNDILAARGCALAGDNSLHLFANEEAIDLALRGLHHLSRVKSGPERTSLRIALLRVLVLASSENRLRRWPRLLHDLTEAVATAEAASLSAEAATGYYLLSVLHQDEGETAESVETTLRAAAASRRADAATAVAQLANTARCLVELETNVDRARTMLTEANALLGRRRADSIELYWAEALLKRWEGQLDGAVPLMEEALQLARAQGDRWRECKCLAWLATMNLECGKREASLACCEELRPLAERMGESGELPFVHALEALCRLTLGLPAAEMELESAVAQLRAFDSKAHLAYVLNVAAERAFQSGRFAEALEAARDALVAAEATRRVWEAATSRALLAQIFAAQGDRSAGRHHLDPVLACIDEQDALSARARAMASRAAKDLDVPIPTPNQTLS